jgi:hypothetical protein
VGFVSGFLQGHQENALPIPSGLKVTLILRKKVLSYCSASNNLSSTGRVITDTNEADFSLCPLP